MGYNVVHNPIGTVNNVSLASARGQELHPPILSTLSIHGVRVKIDRDRREIFQLFQMNMEYLFFITITNHFQFSFDFSCYFSYLVNIGLLIGFLVFFVSLRHHSPTTSINKA